MGSFDLILQGKFEEAIKESDFMFKKTKSNIEKFNKIISLLNVKKYTDAYDESRLLLKISDGNHYYLIHSLCCILLSLNSEALKYLELNLEGKYTDISNGIYTKMLMYYLSNNKEFLWMLEILYY